MNTFGYKGYWIHETFMSDHELPLSMIGEPRVKVQTPDFKTFPVKSVHAAKCLITRLIKQ